MNLKIESDKEKKIYNFYGIECVHVQKIGVIQVKKNSISIYNIETQLSSLISDEKDTSKKMVTLTTMGNLNTTGLIV